MKSSDSRIGSKIDPAIRREDAAGVRYDIGPYIGVVKNNQDPTRSGRLQVWISDLSSGDENNPNNWRTVSYASPFWGSTVQEPYGPEQNLSGSNRNSFSNVRHTYGFWHTPPDLENFVLCVFVAGDPFRGYWFACVPNQFGHHMVPALASSLNIDTATIEDPQLKSQVTGPLKGQPLPVAEFNEYANTNWANFTEAPKPLHEYQARRLIAQGLDRIKLTGSRGAVFTTSQRETPSSVFGISTPGRVISKQANTDKTQATRVRSRTGGHQFVMDDGNERGLNSLIRIKTIAGHQILMDDTDKILYIANSDGSAYVELTGTGHVNVYAANGINMRASGDFNLHVDRDININAGGSVNIAAQNRAVVSGKQELVATSDSKVTVYGATVGLGSSGRLDITAKGGSAYTAGQQLMIKGKLIGLNSGAGPQVSKPAGSTVYNSPDTRRARSGIWEIQENAVKSVAKLVPTHEPWSRREGRPSSASSGALSAGLSGLVGAATNEAQAAVAASVPGAALAASAVQAATNPELASSFNVEGTIAAGVAPVLEVKEAVNSVLSAATPGGVNLNSIGQAVSEQINKMGQGLQAAISQTVKDLVPKNFILSESAVNPPDGVGSLDQLQVKSLLTQMAYTASSFNYSATSSDNLIGKYQMSAKDLADLQYLKPDGVAAYPGNGSIVKSTCWTGLNGVNSLDDWKSNPAAQEDAMFRLMNKNYNTLVRNGGISSSDDQATVSGMLAVAHRLGVDAAKQWRQQGTGGDQAVDLFNQGRSAVDLLARGK